MPISHLSFLSVIFSNIKYMWSWKKLLKKKKKKQKEENKIVLRTLQIPIPRDLHLSECQSESTCMNSQKRTTFKSAGTTISYNDKI